MAGQESNILPEIYFKKKVFNEIYLNYLYSEADINVFWGGAGSGKSKFIAQRHVILCLSMKYYRLAYFRKYFESLRKSSYQLFKDVIDEWNLRRYFKFQETTKDIVCCNGNRMVGFGCDDPEKIKSMTGFTHGWCEELTEFNQDDFEQIEMRIRSEKIERTQIDVSFNPTDERSWVRKRLFPAVVPVEKSFTRKQTYTVNDRKIQITTRFLNTTEKDNRFLSDQYRAMLENKATYNEGYSDVYLHGRWGKFKTGMEYYSAFKASKQVAATTYDPNLPLWVSFDQNVTPHITALCSQVEYDKKEKIWKINILSEFCYSNPKNKTDILCKGILNIYEPAGIKKINFTGDASGKKRDTRTSENDYDIVERIFRKYINNQSNQVPFNNPRHKRRRDFINEIFEGRFPIIINIDPSCETLITDLETIVEAPDGSKMKTKKKDKETGVTFEPAGHASDCFDYQIMSCFDKMM